ncbi:MAG: branched-chain amino acid aminotransferase [Bacillota bacterium]
MNEIKVQKVDNFKEHPADSELGFGEIYTDHMFLMDYNEEKGWHEPRIVPYGPLKMAPATASFHYGQTTFEGMKAYKSEEGGALLFRPKMNAKRFNNSNQRMCMPELDPDFFVKAVKNIVRVDQDWIPSKEGTSLYIRPFAIADEEYLGLKAASKYKFIIILSPVGAYYPQGLKPTRISVETEYVRAVRGGTGSAKTGGNYASSLKAKHIAAKKGYDEVLWLDGVKRKYIEEVGAMNVFFKIDGKVVTPSLEGSILAGITRDSVIKMLKDWDYEVEERRISIEELVNAYKEGKLEEAFGTGTAAVIAPVGELSYNGLDMEINNFEIGDLTQKLYDNLTGIQTGKLDDPYGWTEKILDK